MITTTRHASLEDLASLLSHQQARKIEIVAGQAQLSMIDGLLQVDGLDPIIEEDGVTDPNGLYRPTAIFDEGVSDKLGIPIPYLRKMRDTRVDLYDANVNGWLHGGLAGTDYAADPRTFLSRCFRADDSDEPGIARAFLSSRFAIIDHLDALTAALDAVREVGTEVEITGCDLTDRRMQVRVEAPSIKAYAKELLKGYRSPFGGGSGDELPIVHAGFVISNSETGGGAFSIKPRFVVEVCKNGMTVTRDALRAVHVGGKLEEGAIRWTEETQRKAVDLVRAKTADAIRTYLDVEYMTEVLARAEEQAGQPIETVDEVEAKVKALNFTEEHIQGVLGFFIKGGQMTVGGVHNAITAYAQEVPDGDTASDLEDGAARLLALA